MYNCEWLLAFLSPSVLGPSYSSYQLPPVVMSPVVSVHHSEGAPTLSIKKKKGKSKENSDNHFRTTEEVEETDQVLCHLSLQHLLAHFWP